MNIGPRIMVILTMMATIVMDTGQGQQHQTLDCRSISDRCSCPQPHTLRCTGKNEDLEDILEKIESVDYGIRLLHITLEHLTVLKRGLFGLHLHLPGLVISTSQLEDIEDKALVNLRPTLTALSLPSNNLIRIPDEVFNLPLLQRLDVSQNFIKSVSNMSKAITMDYLDLSSNKVSDMNEVVLPPNLKTLLLKNNHIGLEDVKSFNFGPLRKMVLSNNMLSGNLTELAFNNKADLRTLDLSFNQLVSLSSSTFVNFPRLRNLDLASNGLELIDPLAFIGLTRLTNLDLSSNCILELPSEVFKLLTNLEHLDLSSNNLQVISGSLTLGLVNLYYLNLGRNDIIRVEPLKDCNHLSTLLLDGEL
jgi:Leucine-rich repeat (LRR) protein